METENNVKGHLKTQQSKAQSYNEVHWKREKHLVMDILKDGKCTKFLTQNIAY